MSCVLILLISIDVLVVSVGLLYYGVSLPLILYPKEVRLQGS
jgi:hypothetical protein